MGSKFLVNIRTANEKNVYFSNIFFVDNVEGIRELQGLMEEDSHSRMQISIKRNTFIFNPQIELVCHPELAFADLIDIYRNETPITDPFNTNVAREMAFNEEYFNEWSNIFDHAISGDSGYSVEDRELLLYCFNSLCSRAVSLLAEHRDIIADRFKKLKDKVEETTDMTTPGCEESSNKEGTSTSISTKDYQDVGDFTTSHKDGDKLMGLVHSVATINDLEGVKVMNPKDLEDGEKEDPIVAEVGCPSACGRMPTEEERARFRERFPVIPPPPKDEKTCIQVSEKTTKPPKKREPKFAKTSKKKIYEDCSK